jgi:hypothetical protein
MRKLGIGGDGIDEGTPLYGPAILDPAFAFD